MSIYNHLELLWKETFLFIPFYFIYLLCLSHLFLVYLHRSFYYFHFIVAFLQRFKESAINKEYIHYFFHIYFLFTFFLLQLSQCSFLLFWEYRNVNLQLNFLSYLHRILCTFNRSMHIDRNNCSSCVWKGSSYDNFRTRCIIHWYKLLFQGISIS